MFVLPQVVFKIYSSSLQGLHALGAFTPAILHSCLTSPRILHSLLVFYPLYGLKSIHGYVINHIIICYFNNTCNTVRNCSHTFNCCRYPLSFTLLFKFSFSVITLLAHSFPQLVQHTPVLI